MPTWDPTQYEKFATLRDRPFLDLLSRVGAHDPQLVVDLGCGNGPLTLLMAQGWPGARIIGIGSSPQMIERAREVDTEGSRRVAGRQRRGLGSRPGARRADHQRHLAVGSDPP